MHYGRYFKLDEDASFIDRGVAVFQYRRDNRIYATFTRESIVFFTVSNIDAPMAEMAEHAERGASNLILHIPLDDNMGKRIASARREDFDADIDGIWNWPERLSYASTFRFSTSRKNKSGKSGGAKSKSPIYHAPETFPGRNLVLDFLFDLQETRVFWMSPHCEELVAKFHENFFARCVAAKARHCYQQAFYRELLKETRANGDSADGQTAAAARQSRKERRKFYGKECYKAEREWTECIRDPRADKTFMDSKGWFEPTEEEMKRIYRPWLPIELDGRKKEEKDENDWRTSKWFIGRYLWWFPLGVSIAHPSFRGLHLFMPRLLFAFCAGWFTSIFINKPQEIAAGYKDMKLVFFLLVLATLYGASWMILRRALPFAKIVYWRAMSLSLLVLAFSFIPGWVFKSIDANFIYLWGSTAFTTMVVGFFIGNKNPSESV